MSIYGDQLIAKLTTALSGQSPIDPFVDVPGYQMPVSVIPRAEEMDTFVHDEPKRPIPRLMLNKAEQDVAEQTRANPELAKLPQYREGSPKRWMARHQNGRIPESELVGVQGLGSYAPHAARALRAMKRAAANDGVVLQGGGYRSYEEQEGLQWKEEQFGIPVAEPGHSNHGWGIAGDFDVTNPKVLKWLQKNAKRFGWVNPDWAQNGVEPWHWEYRGGYKRGSSPRRKRAPASRKPAEVNALEAVNPLASLPVSFASVLGELREPKPQTARAYERYRSAQGLGFVDPRYRNLIRKAAERYNLNPRLLGAVAFVENYGIGTTPADVVGRPAFDPNARSNAGAIGVMQVVPGSHPQYAESRLSNPRYNIFAGAAILASYLQQGDLRYGIASYNAGPSGAAGGGGAEYAEAVLRILKGNY